MAPDVLAAGSEQKNTFCLLKDGAAILSQHIGDLDDARTYDDYRRNIAHYALIDRVFVAAFVNPLLAPLDDLARVPMTLLA